MAHDVFISHSSKDKPTADAVCAVLEAQGIRCWVAPRDILPGRNWGGSIVEAIKDAKAMVLIFSANSNSSEHITREVERAANRGIPIIPVRIENILPTDSLEYFLSSPHWLDAFPPPLDNHLQHLAQVVRQIVVVTRAELPPVPPTPVVVAPEKTEPGKPALAETSFVLAPAVRAVAPEKTEAPNATPAEISPILAPVEIAPVLAPAVVVAPAPAEPPPVLSPSVVVVPEKTEPGKPPPDRPPRFKSTWLAAAAAFVLLLGFGGWYFAVYQPLSSVSVAPSGGAVTAQQTITLIAHDAVRVHLVQELDGTELFQGTLIKGESRSFTKHGSLLLTATVLENIEIEIDGKRQANPYSGYSRVRIP